MSSYDEAVSDSARLAFLLSRELSNNNRFSTRFTACPYRGRIQFSSLQAKRTALFIVNAIRGRFPFYEYKIVFITNPGVWIQFFGAYTIF